MQLFNVGIGELIFIFIIAIIVLGPDRIVPVSKQVGRFIRQVVRSPLWREIMSTSAELRQIPQQLIRETGLQDDLKGIQNEMQQINSNLKTNTREVSNDSASSLSNPAGAPEDQGIKE